MTQDKLTSRPLTSRLGKFSPQSFRLRLAILSAGLAGTALVGFGLTAWVLIREANIRKLNEQLVTQLVQEGSKPQSQQRWRRYDRQLPGLLESKQPDWVALRVLDTKDTVVYQSDAWPTGIALPSPPAPPKSESPAVREAPPQPSIPLDSQPQLGPINIQPLPIDPEPLETTQPESPQPTPLQPEPPQPESTQLEPGNRDALEPKPAENFPATLPESQDLPPLQLFIPLQIPPIQLPPSEPSAPRFSPPPSIPEQPSSPPPPSQPSFSSPSTSSPSPPSPPVVTPNAGREEAPRNIPSNISPGEVNPRGERSGRGAAQSSDDSGTRSPGNDAPNTGTIENGRTENGRAGNGSPNDASPREDSAGRGRQNNEDANSNRPGDEGPSQGSPGSDSSNHGGRSRETEDQDSREREAGGREAGDSEAGSQESNRDDGRGEPDNGSASGENGQGNGGRSSGGQDSGSGGQGSSGGGRGGGNGGSSGSGGGQGGGNGGGSGGGGRSSLSTPGTLAWIQPSLLLHQHFKVNPFQLSTDQIHLAPTHLAQTKPIILAQKKPAPSKQPSSPEPTPKIKRYRHATGQWQVGYLNKPGEQIAIAVNLKTLDRTLAPIRNVGLITIPAILFLVALGAWFLAGQALRPLYRVNASIRRVTAQGLDQRIPYGNTDVEFTELIWAFNQMLERLERSFQQASRFSGDAAHELKTPLAILQGQLERAIHQAPAGSDLQQQLGIMLEEVSHLGSIIRKLLLLSLADAGQIQLAFTEVNLSQLLAEQVEDIDLLAPELKVETCIEPGITVRADRDLLQQVLQNLTTNAVKYNRPDGWIRVELEPVDDEVVVTVTNCSKSLSLEMRDRLFERFYRADAARNRKVQGVGLGLSLAREIARSHRGELRLTAPVAGETGLMLRLPAQS